MKKKISALFVIVMLVMSVIYCTSAEELFEFIQDPGFEEGFDLWTPNGAVEFYHESSQANSGSKSLFMASTGYSEAIYDITGLLKEHGSGKYYFSAYLKSADGDSKAFIYLRITYTDFTSGDVFVVGSGKNGPDNLFPDRWTKIAAPYDLELTKNVDEAYLCIISTPASDLYLDDVSMTRDGLYESMVTPTTAPTATPTPKPTNAPTATPTTAPASSLASSAPESSADVSESEVSEETSITENSGDPESVEESKEESSEDVSSGSEDVSDPDSSGEPEPEDKPSAGIIIGIVLAAAVVLAGVIFGIRYMKGKRKAD